MKTRCGWGGTSIVEWRQTEIRHAGFAVIEEMTHVNAEHYEGGRHW